MTDEFRTVYVSSLEDSEPRRVYVEMREAFRRQSLEEEGLRDHKCYVTEAPRVSKVKVKILMNHEVCPNIYTDNESNNPGLSRRDSQEKTDSSTDNLPIKKLEPRQHSIPMSMDIATQFNSDLNILIEQNSKDSNIINIKFGGPIHGNVEGKGNMPKSEFLSLINQKVTDNVIQKISKSNVKSQKESVDKTIPTIELTKSVNNVKKEQSIKTITKENNGKIPKRSSMGNDESIEYFVSPLPTKPVAKSHEGPSTGKVSQEVIISKEAISSSTDKKHGTTAEYNVPFSQMNTYGSKYPSMSMDTMKPSERNNPAVLPKCIIQRIFKTMTNELKLKKKASSSIFDLENKIALMKFPKNIIDQNWHLAIKRGKIMIGEIIELIITVNIDKIINEITAIESILDDLKSELINSSFYLLSLIDESQNNDVLCLQLIIDIVLEEIGKLKVLANEWIKSGSKLDFSTFFVNKFSLSLSPRNSDITGKTSTSKTTSESENMSKSVENESKTVSLSKSQESLKQNSLKDPILIQTIPSNKESVKLNAEKKLTKENENENKTVFYPDPSIITNSRVKKTMGTIMQIAIEEKLVNDNLPKATRSNALVVKIINEQPIITKNVYQSLIKELSNLDIKWNKPIETGKSSIHDLIEFIINTVAQEQDLSKELYDNVVDELTQLENEMLFSLANNLYVSRNSGKDLMSLCYEILAGVLFEEMTIAKYLFQSLDNKSLGATAVPLGKLYRTYITQRTIPMASDSKKNSINGTENYAHQTSEVKNYANFSIEETVGQPPHKDTKTESRISTESKMKDKGSSSKPSSFISKGLKSSEYQSTKSSKDTDNVNEENQALLFIIEKLNNQTNEINKIKENLQALHGKVDEKILQLKCNFSLDKENGYPSYNNSSKVHLAESTNIHNTHEIIHPNEDSFSSIQPSIHEPIVKIHAKANKSESISYVAPISNKTQEQPIIKDIRRKHSFTESLSPDDILNLIGDGSLNLLNNKSKTKNEKNFKFDSEDSCNEINIEFDKIFEWIVQKYEETIKSMSDTPKCQTFMNSMNDMSKEERRKIEKDLINEIIKENNKMINNWVKEICYKRLLNCLNPQKSKK